jgi:hypothetical protein
MAIRSFGALLALVVIAGVLLAESIPARVVNVDSVKNTITVHAQGKEQTFILAKDLKVWRVVKPAARTEVAILEPAPQGVAAVQPGMDVVLTRGIYKIQYVITNIQIGTSAVGSAAGK